MATSCVTDRKISRKEKTNEQNVTISSAETETKPIATEIQEQQSVIDEDKSNWISAIGNIKGLNVESYRLRGEGPDGAKFGWIYVTSPRIALSGIRRGEWTLYAEALGSDGTVVATGELTTFLSDSTPIGTLFLSAEKGKGNILCQFSWNTAEVLNPSVEIYIKSENGEFSARDKSEIKIEDGIAKWEAKNIPAGSYIVRAILKDEGEVVSGVAAALRVIDGKQSVGDCHFIIDNLSSVFGINLQNSPVDTVTGSIALNQGILSYHCNEAPDGIELSYSWFLDGSALPDSDEKDVDIRDLALKKGFYRFDCIASNKLGFTSINTSTIFVYIDGKEIYQVSENHADNTKGDTLADYEETITTKEDNVLSATSEERTSEISTSEITDTQN